MRPSPWQTGHTVRFLPLPPQRGHTTLNFMLPLFCVICPLPWHSGHWPGLSRKPWPWQLVQTSRRGIVSCISVPLIACQKPTFTWYSRSSPGFGPRHRRLAPAAEDAGEDVAESAATAFAAGRTRALGEVIEVEAAEVERNFLGIGARSASARAATEAARAWPPPRA